VDAEGVEDAMETANCKVDAEGVEDVRETGNCKVDEEGVEDVRETADMLGGCRGGRRCNGNSQL
jgi:hypothetical protein